MVGIYGSIALLGSVWWLGLWATASLLFLVRVIWLPLLSLSFFSDLAPMPDSELKRRLGSCAERAGVRIEEIFESKIAAKANVSNAFVVGMGRRRRVVLTDTLLRDYSADEIEALAAHEFGHVAMHHLLKRVAFNIVVFLAIAWAIRWMAEYKLFLEAPLGTVASLPQLMAVFGGLLIYSSFLLRSIIRRQEMAADRFAWRYADVTAFISGMRKLTW